MQEDKIQYGYKKNNQAGSIFKIGIFEGVLHCNKKEIIKKNRFFFLLEFFSFELITDSLYYGRYTFYPRLYLLSAYYLPGSS